jgi:dTDP-3-amino-2,3,6-trideoxy-4-keto-D-glucose/dTDP-3-amino-3,4,6-trideoxy-alpha-D-glucose/dTDP-2,6-dideoxy-D-kanosamine transaminase
LLKVPLNDPGRLNASLEVELEAVMQRVLRSGRYVLGEEVSAFEAEFAAFCGTRHCVGVGNGTDALELALRAFGLGPGDQVATVANAGMYGSAAILAAGATPLYVDIDPTSMNMSAASLGRYITRSTKAVIVTHLYGRLAAMDELLTVARRAGLLVIEDCAQAHGALRDGRRAGGFGDVGCFSFYPTKNLGALGDGGALVMNDGDLAERLAALRQYGWQQQFLSTPPLGRNSRLDELQAAVLRCKLRHLTEWNAKRRSVVESYRAALDGDALCWPDVTDLDHVAHLCVVRTKARQQLREQLLQRGIASAIHYPVPDYRQPSITSVLGAGRELPETEAATASILSLPCFPDITDDEIDAVIAAVQSSGL